MKKYVINGLADSCPLCIDGGDGRKGQSRPVFLVGSDSGGYTGPCCAPHLAALIRAAEGEKPKESGARVDPKPEPKPAVAVAAAVGSGNGPAR